MIDSVPPKLRPARYGRSSVNAPNTSGTPTRRDSLERSRPGRNRSRRGEGGGRLRIQDTGEGLADLVALARLDLMSWACVEEEDRMSRVLLAIAGGTVCP